MSLCWLNLSLSSLFYSQGLKSHLYVHTNTLLEISLLECSVCMCVCVSSCVRVSVNNNVEAGGDERTPCRSCFSLPCRSQAVRLGARCLDPLSKSSYRLQHTQTPHHFYFFFQVIMGHTYTKHCLTGGSKADVFYRYKLYVHSVMWCLNKRAWVIRGLTLLKRAQGNKDAELGAIRKTGHSIILSFQKSTWLFLHNVVLSQTVSFRLLL